VKFPLLYVKAVVSARKQCNANPPATRRWCLALVEAVRVSLSVGLSPLAHRSGSSIRRIRRRADDKMSPPLARLLRHIALRVRVRVRVHAFYTLRALVGMRGRNYCAQQ